MYGPFQGRSANGVSYQISSQRSPNLKFLLTKYPIVEYNVRLSILTCNPDSGHFCGIVVFGRDRDGQLFHHLYVTALTAAMIFSTVGRASASRLAA